MMTFAVMKTSENTSVMWFIPFGSISTKSISAKEATKMENH